MNFANLTWPWVAAGLAGLAGALWLLHRLRIRHREVVVPTTLFWAALAEEAPARSLTERFRHPLAYLLLLLICSLLWLAFARPVPDRDADGTRYVAMLDGSARMAVGSRFDEAVAALQRHVAALPPARRQVLWSGCGVSTLLNPGEHELLLRQRLDGLRPEAVPGRLDDLLRQLALESRPDRPVVVTVFGDAPFVFPRESDGSMRVERAGGADKDPGVNRGVVALGVADAASGEWTEVDAYIEIAWSGSEDAAPTPVIELDGEPIAAAHLRELPAARGKAWLLAGLPANGGLLQVRLPAGDTLALDDSAGLRLPHRPRIRVQLSPSLDLLRAGLAADTAVDLVNEGGQVAIRREGEAFGTGLPSLEFVPRAGRAAFTFVHPSRLDPRAVLREGVAAIGLREVDATTLATVARQPIEVAVAPGEHWQFSVWADLLGDEYNFTSSRPFPLFLANAVRWLARTPGVTPYAAAGRPFARQAPDSGARLLAPTGRVLDPLGDVALLPAAGTVAVEGEPRPLMVSLLDRATTAPAAAGPNAAASPAVATAGVLPAAFTALLLAALGLLLVEWHLLQRGRIP